MNELDRLITALERAAADSPGSLAVDIPVEPADSRDVDLIVKSWADK